MAVFICCWLMLPIIRSGVKLGRMAHTRRAVEVPEDTKIHALQTLPKGSLNGSQTWEKTAI